jgi:hypothetical protein
MLRVSSAVRTLLRTPRPRASVLSFPCPWWPVTATDYPRRDSLFPEPISGPVERRNLSLAKPRVSWHYATHFHSRATA